MININNVYQYLENVKAIVLKFVNNNGTVIHVPINMYLIYYLSVLYSYLFIYLFNCLSKSVCSFFDSKANLMTSVACLKELVAISFTKWK